MSKLEDNRPLHFAVTETMLELAEGKYFTIPEEAADGYQEAIEQVALTEGTSRGRKFQTKRLPTGGMQIHRTA